MSRFVFTSDPKETVSPGPDGAAWNSDKANIEGATIICLAPGSKAALSFARELRHGQKKPVAKVIGAASDYSTEFVRDTGEYDEVVSTSEDPSDVLARVPGCSKIVLVDFGGRGGVAQTWAAVMSQLRKSLLLVKCGREISEEPSSEIAGQLPAGAVRAPSARVCAGQC